MYHFIKRTQTCIKSHALSWCHISAKKPIHHLSIVYFTRLESLHKKTRWQYSKHVIGSTFHVILIYIYIILYM